MVPNYVVFVRELHEEGWQFWRREYVWAESAEQAAIKAVGVWHNKVLEAEVLARGDSEVFSINPPPVVAEPRASE